MSCWIPVLRRVVFTVFFCMASSGCSHQSATAISLSTEQIAQTKIEVAIRNASDESVFVYWTDTRGVGKFPCSRIVGDMLIIEWKPILTPQGVSDSAWPHKFQFIEVPSGSVKSFAVEGFSLTQTYWPIDPQRPQDYEHAEENIDEFEEWEVSSVRFDVGVVANVPSRMVEGRVGVGALSLEENAFGEFLFADETRASILTYSVTAVLPKPLKVWRRTARYRDG